jgi:lysophospholipase L1-like esterase
MNRTEVLGAIGGLLVMTGAWAAVAENISPVQAGDRIIFLGDSITQQGAKEGGYVDLLQKRIAAAFPGQEVEVIGAGISGNKVPDLQRRLKTDVLDRKPSLVVIFIGVNDVWHWEKSGRGTILETYSSGLKAIIGTIREAGARVLLCSPAVIGENIPERPPALTPGAATLDKLKWHNRQADCELDMLLDEYAAAGGTAAEETGAAFLDLRKAFREYLKEHNPDGKDRGILTVDGVHLNAEGNRFVARAIGRALGLPEEGL